MFLEKLSRTRDPCIVCHLFLPPFLSLSSSSLAMDGTAPKVAIAAAGSNEEESEDVASVNTK